MGIINEYSRNWLVIVEYISVYQADSMVHFTSVRYAGDSILYVGNSAGECRLMVNGRYPVNSL